MNQQCDLCEKRINDLKQIKNLRLEIERLNSQVRELSARLYSYERSKCDPIVEYKARIRS